jgi:hypothetical protein
VFIELVGVWIDAPLPSQVMAAGSVPVPFVARTPQPIEWPAFEDGQISLRIVDQNNQPLSLTLPTPDALEIAIGINFRFGPIVQLTTPTAGPDLGQYIFTVTPDSFRSLSGPYVYEARATYQGKQQQVCSPAYFTVTGAVMSS